MNCVKIMPLNLCGTVKVPPSKSLCHRAIIAAGLTNGTCKIDNVVLSDDIEVTLRGMKDFGVEITKEASSLKIKGNNLIHSIKKEIDCGESGSALRFLIPIALLTSEEITFTGRGRLKQRPLEPYYEIFDKQNIYYSTRQGLPLTVRGMLSPGDYEIKGNISSQFITGLLFALPLLSGDSRIIVTTELESKGYVDLTIDILNRFSVKVENNNYREFIIKGRQKYIPTDYTVEGDFSQAAFWLAAGVLGGDIRCKDMNADSLQGDRAIVDIIRKMGGKIAICEDRIEASTSVTKGIIIDASDCPDLVPILSVLGALSQGTTQIVNAGRLRIKESDRLKAMATELNKLGADIKETEDGLIINGKDCLKGGTVDSWNDHRIAMALSIASIRCDEPVIITGSDSVKKSYPGFFNDFHMLGGTLDEFSRAE